jgi:hypothetical protein
MHNIGLILRPGLSKKKLPFCRFGIWKKAVSNMMNQALSVIKGLDRSFGFSQAVLLYKTGSWRNTGISEKTGF